MGRQSSAPARKAAAVVFPAEEQEAPEAVPALGPAPVDRKGPGAVVLVVEDNKSTNDLLRKVLLGNGYRVVQAFDALQATVVARGNPPHIAILDFEMPAGSGANVYRFLRDFQATSGIPVIFGTGSGRTPELAEILSSDPMTRYMPKPIRVRELLPLMEQLLSPGSPEEPEQEGPLKVD